MDSLPAGLKFKRYDPAKKYSVVVPGLLQRIRRLYEAIYARFGDEGLDLIQEVSRAYGQEIGQRAKARYSFTGVADVGSYLLKVFDMLTEEWEVSELSAQRMIIKVDRCPYPFTDPAICRAHTTMEEALVKALDDSLVYRIGKSIPQGDSYCEHIICQAP